MSSAAAAWYRDEFDRVDFSDKRLVARFLKTVGFLSSQPEAPINKACNSWADTKAAYRLFQNEKVDAAKILASHTTHTLQRAAPFKVILAVQDTSYIDFKTHPKTQDLGGIGCYKKGDTYGLIMHSVYGLTPNGLPIGLLAQKIWARPEKVTVNEKQRAIEDKESFKWLEAVGQVAALEGFPESIEVIHICDREGDIFELFCEAEKQDSLYIVRAAQDRNINRETRRSKPEEKLWEHVRACSSAGQITFHLQAKEGQPERDVVAEVRSTTLSVPPPPSRTKTKDAYLQNIRIGVVYLSEINPPDGIEPVDWMLLTNVKISTFEEIVQVITWYSYRWQIEIFHKILKSGCTIEACRLSTADRLIRYIVTMSIVAWRIHWLTIVSRLSPETPCTAVFSDAEWKSLCIVVAKKAELIENPPSVRTVVRLIASLGGFLGRKKDGEPGPQSLWRGWHRLTDIRETWELMNRQK